MRRLGLVLILLAGCDPAPSSPVPIARVQGTSFDVPSVREKTVEPAPVPEPVPVPVKVEPKPPPPAPLPVPEPKVEPKPAPAPVVETPVVVKAPEPPKPAEEPKPEAPKPVEAPKPPPAEASAKAAPVDEKPIALTFAKINFRYWPQPKGQGAPDPFPKEIKAMNGKIVTIDGYMFPIDFEKGKVRSFMLSRGMFGCCYGDSPQITEVITVSRADGKSMPFEAMARVTGVLEVGEVYDGEGFVDSLYRIKADSVGPAPGVK